MSTKIEYFFLSLVVALSLFSHYGESANILGIFPMPGKSHFVMFERLLKSLAEKGHSVDVVTHFISKEAPSNYNQLSLQGSLPIFVNNLSIIAFENKTNYEMMDFITHVAGYESCEAAMKTPVLKNLLTTTKRYDLLITEIFGSDCMLGFAHLWKIPVLNVISSISHPWADHRVGNPVNTAYIPTYFVGYSSKMTLWERVENTITYFQTRFLYGYLSNAKSNQLAKEFFGPELPDLEQLARNTSLILVNSHFSMNGIRPTVPNFVEVGGLHILPPKPLSKHFESLLNSNPNGIIFLTMGSMIKTESFTFVKLQAIFDAFAQLPYKILWKGVRENFNESLQIPNNIHFEMWMPQMDILCHPNVKLFVSHGGLMGSQEAIYCGVPRLGIPLFADQENNIKAAEKLGTTIRVGYHDITMATVLEAAQKLLNDPRYKENAYRASEVFKDRPISALDNAVYWVEYVIRHKGAPQLRSAALDLAWYQYCLLDVALILGTMVLVPILVVIYLGKLLLCRRSKRKID